MPISFSNGDVGLSALAATDPSPFAEAMAAAAGEVLEREAIEATPIEHGETRRRWERSGVEKVPALLGQGWRVTVQNRYYVANFLEHGTAAHEVKPDDEKAIETPRGPRAKAYVQGIKGRHMTAVAAAKVEAAAEQIAEPIAEAFAAEVERRYRDGR